jgi:ActR/RegA family two-component response regulator
VTQTKSSISHRLLLFDDDAAIHDMMSRKLVGKGFDVLQAACVTEALKPIATEGFDVLIRDLHMPNPNDGLTVITAMRHSQREALRLLVSGYPEVKSPMDAILLEADHIIVKLFETRNLADMVHEKLLTRANLPSAC